MKHAVRFKIRSRLFQFFILVMGALASLPACNHGGKRMFESRRSTAEYLDMALDGERADDRRRGVVGLAQGGEGKEEWAVKVYDTIARTDADPMVRCAALRALLPCVDPPRVETCLKLLRSVDEPYADVREAPPMVRWAAALLLQHAVDQGAFEEAQRETIVTTLLSRLGRERDSNTRLAMIETLASFPERRVLTGLIDTLPDENFTIQHAAELSLAMLTGVTHDHDPDDWRAWLDSTPEPFAHGGQLPPSLRQPNDRGRWDFLGWMD